MANWPIPIIKGFAGSGKYDYKSNVELKNYFNCRWTNSKVNERIDLSKIIVSDWGGVKSNLRVTLENYVNEIEGKYPKTPLKGIASYSKIFAVTNLDQYAIYDARVAVSLNAVQFNAGLKKGVAFNYVNGRNNITGHSTKKIGFAYHNEFIVKNLVKKGWTKIKKDETYGLYIDTLLQCLKQFPNNKLYDLEMVLFANAEKECKKALESLENIKT